MEAAHQHDRQSGNRLAVCVRLRVRGLDRSGEQVAPVALREPHTGVGHARQRTEHALDLKRMHFLSADIRAVVESEAFRDKTKNLGINSYGNSPQELSEMR